MAATPRVVFRARYSEQIRWIQCESCRVVVWGSREAGIFHWTRPRTTSVNRQAEYVPGGSVLYVAQLYVSKTKTKTALQWCGRVSEMDDAVLIETDHPALSGCQDAGVGPSLPRAPIAGNQDRIVLMYRIAITIDLDF